MTGVLLLPAASYARRRGLWLAARRTGLGASDTAAVLGLDPWRSEVDVWLDKTGRAAPDDTVAEAAEWGIKLEAVVARAFQRRHRDLGRVAPTPGLLAHPDHPWMLATPDRLLLDTAGDVAGLLEIKTCSRLSYRDRWVDGQPPTHILVQVQQQLAVTGLPFAYVAVLVGGQMMPPPVRVDRDEDAIGSIITHAGAWWKRHVVADVRPEVTVRDCASLDVIWPGDTDLSACEAGRKTAFLVEYYVDALRQITMQKARAESLKVRIAAVMGDATDLVDGDRCLVTWRPHETTGVNLSGLRQDHPELVAAYTTTATVRPFRVQAQGQPALDLDLD